MATATPAFPRIELSAAERASYDEGAELFLQQAVAEYASYPGYLDQDAWTHVRRARGMSVYKSAYGVRDPQVTLMMSVGSLPGSLADVMSGLYCDTTEDLRTVRTLLKHPLVDAGVLNVSARASEDEPFRFAGIKWFSAKAAWGMAQTRDVLAYERMGRTRDARGHELAYHVLYSIDRPEWPADALKGVKRQHQISCFLYRQLDAQRVECFLWATIYRPGSVSQRLAEFVVAGALLAVVHAPESARARKLSTLMASVRRPPGTGVVVGSRGCYTCRGQTFLSSNVPCAGCAQFVCKACSAKEKVFSLDLHSRRVQTRRFCRYCVDRTAATEEQGFDQSVAASKRRRRRKDRNTDQSIDARLRAAPIATAVPRTQPRKPAAASEFSSARHWTSASSESTSHTARSNSTLKFSDMSDSDDTSGDEEELLPPRALTAADLVALSREPVKPSKRSGREAAATSARGRSDQWSYPPNGRVLMHDEQQLDESMDGMAMLEPHHEADAADEVDRYHQSPDGVDDPRHLHAASGLSQFSLGMEVHDSSYYDRLSDSESEEETFHPNRTLVMPRSLRSKRELASHAEREPKTDNKMAFLSELYSLSVSQVRHGPRPEQPRSRG